LSEKDQPVHESLGCDGLFRIVVAQGETAAVYLVTGEEYEKMREYMLLGKDAADAGSSLYLKIEMKAADIAPQQEAFYVRAEDMVIQESVREF